MSAAFRLGDLAVPVIQAPMAGIATPELAAGASLAGALGALGLGASSPDQARAMMAEVAARIGSNRYGVNLFCHAPAQADPAREATWLDYLAPEFARFGATPPAILREIYPTFLHDDAMLAAVLDAGPAVVSFHFGIPDASRIAALRDSGALLLATATSWAEARAAQAAGLDGIVAQGFEAGGHRGVFDPSQADGRLSTADLMAALQPLGLPLIPAGGIMDGADAAHWLRAGAPAVQMGTAFLACPESAASAEHRAGLTGRATVMTPAISGRPARGLENRLTALGADPNSPPVPDYPIAYDAAKQLNAAASGAPDYAAHWAGTGAARARALPVAELVALLDAEIRAGLAAGR